ncbi:MAG: DUF1800 domain-containing protein [Novosphingobium sp.]|uniref:DUF1800 domain-containing protein n=1 Tax=Novosphingobium sp. TaxID=1874826 RepID=UPI0032BDD5DD
MDQAAIALNRFGLGGLGDQDPPSEPRRWLESQFAAYQPAPAIIASQTGSARLIEMLREARDDRRERKDEARAAGTDPKPKDDNLPGPYRPLREVYIQAAGARITAALTSPAPFLERLVHFWSNHFAISIDKVSALGLAGAYEFEAIRPHLLGRFGDMLNAVERHPGMLLYLDQAESIGPESPLGTRAAQRGKQRGLNENLAREILELHTLGVRTGYNQQDVTEFARALTGWTLGGIAKQPALRGPGPKFWFAAVIHQPGTRTIMGKRYAQSGEAQAQAVLDDLAAHPSTAKHIATKLARHFAGDVVPIALVTRLEKTFLSTRGDLPSLYRVLMDAPEVWGGTAKFRSPWDWTLAALRATGIKSLPGKSAAGTLQQLGQPIWKPSSPAGYDDLAESWAGPDALVRRVEVAQRLAQRSGAGIDARKLAGRLFAGALSPSTAAAIQRAESGEQALALLLAAPEMMRR